MMDAILMEGFAEKEADLISEVQIKTKHRRYRSEKERVSARRKKTYYKSRKRYEDAISRGWNPTDNEVGMMKNFQMFHEDHSGHYFDCSVSTMKRLQSADERRTYDDPEDADVMVDTMV